MPAQGSDEHQRLVENYYMGMSCEWPLAANRPLRTGIRLPARLAREGLDASRGVLNTANLEVAVLHRAGNVIAACEWIARHAATPAAEDAISGHWHWLDMMADLCELRGLVELPDDPSWTEQRALLSQLLEDAMLAVERLAELSNGDEDALAS